MAEVRGGGGGGWQWQWRWRQTCTKIAAHFKWVLRARRSPSSWRAKVSNSEAIMVRENIAMIVEEINRPLNVAIAHLDMGMRWGVRCGVR